MIFKQYDYSLAKRGKWICPECGRKTFVCYVDNDNNVLNANVGKCDRADHCNYHYPPKSFFEDNKHNGITTRLRQHRPTYQPAPRPTYFNSSEFIKQHGDVFRLSVEATKNHLNHLITFLNDVFGEMLVQQIIADYYIGTSKHWDSSTVFWQIDRFGNVHGGKIMQYDPTNGKRVKEPSNRITWVHSAMRLDGFNLSQCLFGEHLLKKSPASTVAIVESEKTAIIASGVFADCITLACGGCGNLTAKMCEPLRGRDVVLFPDNGKFEEWREKGKQLRNIFGRLRIANIMEREATHQGDDIGDLLVERFPTFSQQQTETISLDLGLEEINNNIVNINRKQ